MKLLVINPNTTRAITDRLVKTARRAASRGTTIAGVTGKSGPKVVTSRADNAVAARNCLGLGAKHGKRCDAVLLGISLDTALRELRNKLAVPVIGMTEAGLLVASTLGERYGVLTFGLKMVGPYRELVKQHGLAARLASVAAVDLPPTAVFDDPAAVRRQTLARCKELIANGAQAIVLAGAVYAGMRRGLQKSVRVPLVDGIESAVVIAEGLVRLEKLSS